MSRHAFAALLLCLSLAACKKHAPSAQKAGPAVSQESADPEEAAAPRAPEDVVRPVYPVDAAKPDDPLAVRVCEALHRLPEERRAACCTTQPGSNLAGECARTVSAAIRDEAVSVDAAALDRCTAALAQQLAGCDWVTPILPAPPAECRGLLVGQVAAATRCRSSLECQVGLYCRGLGPTQTGVCAAPAGVGQACSWPADPLAVLVREPEPVAHPACAGICQFGRCEAQRETGHDGLPKLGEKCQADCVDPLVCIDGSCRARRAAGEPCTTAFECKGACLVADGGPNHCGMQCSADVLVVPPVLRSPAAAGKLPLNLNRPTPPPSAPAPAPQE